MKLQSFFESKNYPTIMFLALILLSIIILFSFVNFVQDVDEGLTAYAIAQQERIEQPAEQELINQITEQNITESEEAEIYTTKAWSIFYIIIIAIIILVAAFSIILKKTIQRNIKEEDKEQKGMV